MTSGNPSDAIDDAVRANIVAADYGRRRACPGREDCGPVTATRGHVKRPRSCLTSR
jgi:hypothetical protein